MDPITIMALAGGAMQLFGGMEQSRAEAWQLEDEAINATKNAKLAREAGQFNAMKQGLEANQIIGRAITDFGASGIEMDSGNVLDVIRQSAVNAELDRQTILRGAELEARQYESRARSAKIGAGNAQRAGMFNFASGLLGIGSNIAGKSAGRGKTGTGNGTIQESSSNNYSSDFRAGNLRIDSNVAG